MSSDLISNFISETEYVGCIKNNFQREEIGRREFYLIFFCKAKHQFHNVDTILLFYFKKFFKNKKAGIKRKDSKTKIQSTASPATLVKPGTDFPLSGDAPVVCLIIFDNNF